MRSPRQRLIVALSLVLAGFGCGRAPGEREVLIDWSPAGAAPKALADSVRFHGGMWMLARGWTNVGKKGVWTLGSAGTIQFRLPARDLEFELTVATSPQIFRRGRTAEILFNDTPLDTLDLEDRWQPQVVRLAVPGNLVQDGANRLVLRPSATGLAEDGQEGMGVYLTRLRLTGIVDERRLRALRGRDIEKTVYRQRDFGSAGRAGPRPDVLVVLLDAARADHFGCYGYERDTTPFIDSLAAEGVVFTRVMAAAPYTLCSVPTILTGRSWLEHDVVDPGDILPAGLPTLAELMQAAGYYTVGFTENPYVSRLTGLDRGFLEFHQSWSEDGEVLAPTRERVAEAVADFDPDRPVFCYVHLRPPHEPYNPPPEHDLFGDPSYEGPANGELEYILAVGTGKLAWSPADRDQLMALYDGNLHMGDAWTRRIVEAWREQRPGRETVTIVLSDHGEAFGEHGHFSHNSTLYDEMIHVPLIIHPRHRAESLGDPGDLRSLADVTPMVLRLVGAAVPAEVSWPEHFVQVRRGRAGARPSIVQRIAGGEWVGLRTPEFLALYRDSRHQELYDTQADPGQTHDLRLEEGGAYAAPVGTILRLLDHKAEFGLEADSGEFDPAAEQRLKALGY